MQVLDKRDPLIVLDVVNLEFQTFAATAPFMVMTVLAWIASLVAKGHVPSIATLQRQPALVIVKS